MLNLILYLSVGYCLTIVTETTKIEVAQSTLQLFETLHVHCEQKTKVKDLDNYIKEFNSNKDINNKGFQCYIQCMMNEAGVLDENTLKFDLSPMEGMYPKEYIDTIREDCYKCADKFQNVPDLCERSYLIFKCTHNVDPENIIAY